MVLIWSAQSLHVSTWRIRPSVSFFSDVVTRSNSVGWTSFTCSLAANRTGASPPRVDRLPTGADSTAKSIPRVAGGAVASDQFAAW